LTQSKTVLSRENFRYLREKILRTLQQHGFKPQPRNRPSPDEIGITKLLEAACRITADVSEDVRPDFVPVATNLDGKKMNRLVIDVAIAMAHAGIPGMATNDSLNALWLIVCDLLQEMGYKNPITDLSAPNEPKQVAWSNYSRWCEICVPPNRPLQKQA